MRLRKDNAGIAILDAMRVLEFIRIHEPDRFEVCNKFLLSRATFKRILEILRLGGADVVAVRRKLMEPGSAYYYKVIDGSKFNPEILLTLEEECE